MTIKMGNIVMIKQGWENAGRRGLVIGLVSLGQDWVGVLWADEDDEPDWFKAAGLEIVK